LCDKAILNSILEKKNKKKEKNKNGKGRKKRGKKNSHVKVTHVFPFKLFLS
jgi:hypothetical protein